MEVVVKIVYEGPAGMWVVDTIETFLFIYSYFYKGCFYIVVLRGMRWGVLLMILYLS